MSKDGIKVGQLVLVDIGSGVQEVGTVVELNCPHYEDEKELDNGILVRTHVSRDTLVYNPEDVQLWTETAPSSRRRSSSPVPALRSIVTPSPSSSSPYFEEEKKPAAKRKRLAAANGKRATQKATEPKPHKTVIKKAVSVASKPAQPAAVLKEAAAVSQEKSSEDDTKKSAEHDTEKSSEDDTKKHSESDSKKRMTIRPVSKLKASTQTSLSIESDAKKPAAKSTDDDNKNAVAEEDFDISSGDDDNESSGDDSDYRFRVEYSPSGRATCRRCDETIPKGAVRICHVPLFRGRPGYTVYRHLPCAVLDENVKRLQDVGGWRKLTRPDRLKIAKRIAESRVELEKEKEELQPDELVQEKFSGEMRASPPGLEADLLPFQVEGSSWMYCQEVNQPEVRGGILADEMGMGKTLQTLVTMLDNRPILQHTKPGVKHPPSAPDLEARQREEALWANALKEWNHELDMVQVPKKTRPKTMRGARAGTLVVCPVIALSQWKTEIEKFTAPNTLTVGTYHGPSRNKEMPKELLQKYDVVLTTYQVLEQDFRKMVAPNKVTCPNCGGKYKMDKLRVHLKYFCGEGAQRTEAQRRQRRAGERRGPGNGGGPPGGGGRGGKGKKRGKKPPMSKTAAKKQKTSPTQTASRKTIHVRASAQYDSDSELSVEEDFSLRTTSRPSRSAAVKASKKVRTSMKSWGANQKKASRSDDDESSFAWENSDDSDSSGDESDIPFKNFAKKPASVDEEKEGCDEDDDSSVDRAIARQQKAMNAAKKSSRKTPKKKATPRKPAGKKTAAKKTAAKKYSKKKTKATKKGKGKMISKSPDSSGGSSDSDSDDSDSVDPLAGIDLDELAEEALAGSRFSLLHSFCWWRVVLDEAHMIKSRSSQTAAAAFALTSIHRWNLSGTPLQNRVSEMYSLVRFLRIEPMAYYFCRQKGCDCKSLHYRMVNGVCQGCNHRSFSHFAHFNKHILNPIQRDGYSGDGRRAMFKLKNEVLDKCMLRRTKATQAADLELPPRFVTLRSIRLHPVEEDFYNALYTQTKASFDDYVAEGTMLNNYAHIFDLLTKMRQAVNHPYLIVYSKTNADRNQGNTRVANGSVDCDMCHEPPTDRILSSCCGSGFCRSCVVDYVAGAGGGESTPCPSCRAPFTIDLNQESSNVGSRDGTLAVSANPSSSGYVPSLKSLSHVATGSILRRINLAEFATSTKIEVLIQELLQMRKQRPGSKALVFSQFVNMLDLVRWRLHSDPLLVNLDLGVRILHGGMDVNSRNAALKSFREDPSVRVLLMSLKSAGVALNLTAASEVFLLDLWWNPAAEMQALDRCHRIGACKPIRAVRFVAAGTVEERVLQMQEKKRLVFDGTVGRDAGSLKMLSAEDMKALFT